MQYVGIDLHKKTIVVCVVNQERTVTARKRFACADTAAIEAWFRQLGPFQFVVEATATYEWLVQLLEPLATSWVLAHPRKFRVIAESAQKTDQQDAQVLAEFLALGMIPKAYRPTAREREHRQLVRHRVRCRQQVSKLKCQLRYVAARYNADVPGLFQGEHLEALQQRRDLTSADRFVLASHLAEYTQALARHRQALQELTRFAQAGTAAEQRQREIIRSAPGLGVTLTEVVLAELGDVTRFRSLKDATAYAGLVPKLRDSDGKRKELGITKQGSRVLRWGMVQAAWQAVLHSARWRSVYAGLKRRRGAKRAIIAVARRLLSVLVAMLKADTLYQANLAELRERDAKAARRRRRVPARAAAVDTVDPAE